MRRTRTTWLIFAGALLAAAGTVGWLTLGVLKAERLAEQMQQQALLDSKVRVALWRLDAVAAPLLALESSHSEFLPANEGAPQLSTRLIKGAVQRDQHGNWSVRPLRKSAGLDPQKLHDALAHSNWWQSLVDPLESSPTGQQNPTSDGLLIANALAEYVDWPKKALSQLNKRNFTQQTPIIETQVASKGAVTIQREDLAARQQLVGQVGQLAIGSLNQAQVPSVGSGNESHLNCVVGPYSSIWVGTELLLARKVRWTTNQKVVVECRILDWPKWESLLTSQIADSFPQARLVPRWPVTTVTNSTERAAEWQMVSLPIGFEPQVIMVESGWSRPLVVAWVMLGLAALAVGWLLWQTQSLSERRAAFVSAVTHELRTPLTTFRLYTEMLSEGLVPDTEQQRTYFRTLACEANRLTHLVENVLSFARLERGRTTARHESWTVGALLERCESRLIQRVAETSLQWSCEIEDAVRDVVLLTNVTAIEQVLFNLVDNACKYATESNDPRLLLKARREGEAVLITLRDFGPGLSESAHKTLFTAFEKSSAHAAETAPGIGLGLSLSRRLARDLGGDLRCVPGVSPGVMFELWLR